MLTKDKDLRSILTIMNKDLIVSLEENLGLMLLLCEKMEQHSLMRLRHITGQSKILIRK